jgi:ParB family chromosome partitioning protein
MTTAARRSGGLGRGLGSLIPHRSGEAGVSEVPISRVASNPYQPRQRIPDDELRALAGSIAEHGVLQPIVVTETLDGYELIAGERRLRAAALAGLERIPAVVRQVVGREQLELALVENIQRADLNAIEEARAYRQLGDFGLSQAEIARRIGRSQSAVANTLRLLELPAAIQQAVIDAAISEGHARAIAGLAHGDLQEELLAIVVARSLAVRETEELVRRLKDRPSGDPQRARLDVDQPRADPELERIETELRDALGTKVTLTTSRRGGRIVIEYYDRDDLGRLYERLLLREEPA